MVEEDGVGKIEETAGMLEGVEECCRLTGGRAEAGSGSGRKREGSSERSSRKEVGGGKETRQLGGRRRELLRPRKECRTRLVGDM